MIVLGGGAVGECVSNPCAVDQLWTGEVCLEMYGVEGCNGMGQMMVYNVTGGVQCGCDDGWTSVEGVCVQHSTQGWCSAGEILVQSPNTQYCSGTHPCVEYQTCDQFMSDLDTLKWYKQESDNYKAGVSRLSGQVCDNIRQHVCCQETQVLTDSLQLTEVLHLIHKYHRLNLSCSPSPCNSTSLPWPGRQGCFPLSGPGPSEDCQLVLVIENQQEVVKCMKPDLDITIRNVPMAYSHKCAQGRIWSRFRGRCVKNFF